MSSVSSISPVRLPDAASIEAILARLDPASVDAEIVPALATAFPSFDFSLGLMDDDYRRDSRSVIRPDGTRLGELRDRFLYSDAKATNDRFAIRDKRGNPVWHGRFFTTDHDYNGEQSSGEIAAAKKAVWLASDRLTHHPLVAAR